MSNPLQYNISDWHQLVKCRSNNSVDLSISVSDIVQSEQLRGTRITVNHTKFGTVFSYIVGASGTMVSDDDRSSVYAASGVFEIPTDAILSELAKYGFIVTYDPRENLDGDQLSYLLTLSGLGYDKIRVLPVWRYANGAKTFQHQVVAFMISKCPKWLDNTYSERESVYTDMITNGYAINVSAMSRERNFNWTWLDYVANISDILADNAR